MGTINNYSPIFYNFKKKKIMKTIFLLGLLIASSFSFSQTIATTDEGRKVKLKDDKTWEYIDSTVSNQNCGTDANFEEPKTEKSLYKILKVLDATTDDLKKHVAVENEVSVSDVILLSASEQKGSGAYVLCVKGQKMKYRRTGSVFSKLGEDVLK